MRFFDFVTPEQWEQMVYDSRRITVETDYDPAAQRLSVQMRVRPSMPLSFVTCRFQTQEPLAEPEPES